MQTQNGLVWCVLNSFFGEIARRDLAIGVTHISHLETKRDGWTRTCFNWVIAIFVDDAVMRSICQVDEMRCAERGLGIYEKILQEYVLEIAIFLIIR
jgi:hypothetical protein